MGEKRKAGRKTFGRFVALALAASLAVGLAGCGLVGTKQITNRATTGGGIHKIKHVIVIMQENRSFDNYFGTFPGADGIPIKNGKPAVCAPDPQTHRCIRPYHDGKDVNYGGPHLATSARKDINGGKMNGFVRQERLGSAGICKKNVFSPGCSGARRDNPPDVMGYHDAREIPNYWAYAHRFVLQDHMFESDASWSLPAHLYTVSGWSARCAKRNDPMSCRNAPEHPELSGPKRHRMIAEGKKPPAPDFAWTDLTYLLHKYGVSWRYYVAKGGQPDCADSQMFCGHTRQGPKTPGIWNPLPHFDTVKQDHQLRNIQSTNRFFEAAKSGKLPAVSWIVPNGKESEHPPARVSVGQAYVTRLVNAAMKSPDWKSTAIFITWDDWGGFYDHVKPPVVDRQGYGLRVPGLVVSPYAKRGYVDHQTLSFDAYLKFIEDDFLHGQRLNPKTDGRPDPRPDVRENAPQLGNLLKDFDFNQKPRPPMILPEHPKPGPTSTGR